MAMRKLWQSSRKRIQMCYVPQAYAFFSRIATTCLAGPHHMLYNFNQTVQVKYILIA